MATIEIPHDPSERDGRWRPRSYQRDLWSYLEHGGKRAMAVWRRRSGKDEICLHWACVAAHKRVGNYWHMLPQAAQARKAIWDAVDPERQMRRADLVFPQAIRRRSRDSDMWIEFKNGSTWQVVGSDNFDSLVGSPPVGIVFSEWALADPYAWAYLEPILEENDGWALFITTPRGPNHAERMYRNACVDESWHASLLDGPATGMDELTLERLKRSYIADFGEIMGQSLFDQEYLCSFEAATPGAIYAKEMRDARTEGRICAVPYDPALPVETWWDLGYSDPTGIWFIQRTKAGQLRAIEYYENRLVGVDHYAKILGERDYVYSNHYVPHDAAQGEAGSGSTYLEQANKLGLRLIRQPRDLNLNAGINATRVLIRKMVFDTKRCERGVSGLMQYHYTYDRESDRMSPKPKHDWASHPSDALRTGAHVKVKSKRERPELPRMNVI